MIFDDRVNVNDPSYKAYESIFFETYKLLASGDKPDRGIMMSYIRSKFPYFKHTMPKVMAIAYYMLQQPKRSEIYQSSNEMLIQIKDTTYPYSTSTSIFDKEQAATLVENVFKDYQTAKNKRVIVLDVARYYEHLTK